MEYEFIKLEPDEAIRTLDILKNKRKVNEFSLNMVLSRDKIKMAKFNIIQETENKMMDMVMQKAEEETQGEGQDRHFILLSKSREDLKDGVLIKVIAEIYYFIE